MISWNWKVGTERLVLKGWYWKAGSGCLPLLPGRRMSGNRKLSGKIRSSHRIQQFSSHGVLRHYNNKIYREYRNYDAANQGPCSLNWRKYQPMWRRRITGRALAATNVAIAFWYHNRTWISIFNRSICLRGEKSLMVVSQVKGSYYSKKRRLFVNSRRRRRHDCRVMSLIGSNCRGIIVMLV
jgi:hypothetical protein